MTAQAAEQLPLPKVSGRHRNKPLAAARKAKAIQLKTQGWTYQQIADEMGYQNRGSVYAIIKSAQASQLSESVEEHRELELERLNSMQSALWPDAVAGDVAAAQAVLKIIDARCRLLGLYEVRKKRSPKDVWDNCQGPPTVVPRPNDCRHVGCETHGRFG